jgi:hypothetical protein
MVRSAEGRRLRMNKQEIEKEIQWHKELLNLYEFDRATYEDICGTGDLTEEERKEVYDDLDGRITMMKVSISALQQQLNNGWISVSERLPTNEIDVLITVERQVKNELYNKTFGIVSKAFYHDGTTKTEDSMYDWENYLDYEEEECEMVPKGWYESVEFNEQFSEITDKIIAWQPLPEPYKENAYERD